MAVNEQNIANGSIVVAYFANGEDAQRAITELKDEGFQTNQIGAAFHSAQTGSAGSAAIGANTSGVVGKEVGNLTDTTVDADSKATGPKSDTSAVTPAGLATGSGTGTAGASRPGPIPGSDIPHHRMPAEHEPERSSFASAGSPTLAPGISLGTGSTDTRPAESSSHKSHEQQEGSWWQRLMHVFGDDSQHESDHANTTQTKSSTNFGTGEGHLGISPQGSSYEYSGRTFESSFSGMGVPADHSRRLARELGQGGAVVTVRESSRDAEAESILERNGGRIRHESSAPSSSWTGTEANDSRVELFGDVRKSYRPFSDSDKDDVRRAS